MRPDSYYDQYACINCEHVVKISEWDSAPYFYCNYGDTSKRPLSGSVMMQESYTHLSETEWNACFEAWGKWSEGKRVNSHGRCDSYSKGSTVDNE